MPLRGRGRYCALNIQLVYFLNPLRIPVPGREPQDVQALMTPDHGLGFFGTLDMRVDLNTRILSCVLQGQGHHVTFHVPLEQVASWVECS